MTVMKVVFHSGVSIEIIQADAGIPASEDRIKVSGLDGFGATLSADDLSAAFPYLRGWMELDSLEPVHEDGEE